MLKHQHSLFFQQGYQGEQQDRFSILTLLLLQQLQLKMIRKKDNNIHENNSEGDVTMAGEETKACGIIGVTTGEATL